MPTQAPPRKENPSTALFIMLSMDSFLWKRKARTRCAGEKRGKRAGGGASRAPHRREGTESGVAWNEKERRCVVEAHGRVEKAHGESKRHAENRKSAQENRKNKGRAIEKQGIAESKRRSRNPKECGARNPKAHGRGIRKRAICPPPCRDEEFG